MQALFGLFAGGTAATTTAAAAAPAAAATTTAATGLSLSQVISGGATLLSSLSAISAGQTQARALEMQANDAEMQKPLELLQGLQRKNEAQRAMMQAVSDIDTSYAASGADLSFGTASVARKAAFREGDLAMNSNSWTTGANIDRLEERKKEYLRMAGRARMAGLFDGFATGLSGFAKLAEI